MFLSECQPNNVIPLALFSVRFTNIISVSLVVDNIRMVRFLFSTELQPLICFYTENSYIHNNKPVLPSLCLRRVTVSISDGEPSVLNASNLYHSVGHYQ